MRVKSFPPLAGDRPTRLILGSMPGVASLTAGRYYAHPQNAFWRIMADVVGLAVDQPYDVRVAALVGAGIAVWDVLQACERSGSLDSAIRRDSEVANDIPGLLAAYPAIRQICFNGAAAETSFRRHHRDLLRREDLRFVRLPSTSAAHASMPYARKCAVWREALTR